MTQASDIAAHILGELDRVGRLADGEETAQFIATLLKGEYPDATEEVIRLAIEQINKAVREASESRRLGLRAIEPISLAGLDVGEPEHGQPICEWVNPRDLRIDPLYQRNIGERGLRHIRRMIENFDWNQWSPPICSYAEHNGETVLMVLDGQHRSIAAASHPKIALVPVMICDAPVVASQAETFVKQNTGRLGVTALQLHKSSLVAEDGDAVVVDRTCRRAGIKVLGTTPKKYAPGETVAINAISSLVERRGALKAKAILEVLAKGNLAPVTAHHVKAAEFLMTDEEYSNGISGDDLAEAIAKEQLATAEEAKQLTVSHKWPLWKAIAVIWFKKTRKRRLTTGRAAA